MTLTGKSVFVTGGTGFIGSRLVEKLVLEHNARVRVLVRNVTHASRIACFPIEMVGGDIADPASVEKAVQGCDVVFHCAYDFSGTREAQNRTGIEGTRHVSEAVLQEGVSRLVHVSTFAVYGTTPEGDLTESSPWLRPQNTYIRVKREAERMLLDLHRQKGLPVVIVQPTLVYGPFSVHWSIHPVNRLQTGVVPLVDGGQGYCNAVYIDDVVDAMLLAASQPDVLGETFLISAQEPITWKMFYGALQDALGIRATVEWSEQELRQALQQRARRARTLPLVMSWIRHPQVFAELARLPMAQTAFKVLKNCLSDNQWAWLKSRVLGNKPQRHVPRSHPEPFVHLPSASLLSLYTSKTRVRIEKATQRLGYSPKFDFEQGMELTLRFLQWANLAHAGDDTGGS
jgi:nucleoside-diphosphate-sugar epimerase